MARLGRLRAAAASLAAGCGGDGGGDSSATEWAGDVCSAITTWTDSITSTADSLSGGNLGEDALRSAVDDLASATSDFVDDVRGLGTPDTEAGEQAKESLDQLADEVDENLSTMQDAVDDASGASGVVEAVTAVSGAMSTMGAAALLDLRRARTAGSPGASWRTPSRKRTRATSSVGRLVR